MNTLCHELSTILLLVLPVNHPLGVILELKPGSSKRFKPVYITLPWQRGWSGFTYGPAGVGESAILQTLVEAEASWNATFTTLFFSRPNEWENRLTHSKAHFNPLTHDIDLPLEFCCLSLATRQVGLLEWFKRAWVSGSDGQSRRQIIGLRV